MSAYEAPETESAPAEDPPDDSLRQLLLTTSLLTKFSGPEPTPASEEDVAEAGTEFFSNKDSISAVKLKKRKKSSLNV